MEGSETADVAFLVAGRVARVLVEEGRHVSKGQRASVSSPAIPDRLRGEVSEVLWTVERNSARDLNPTAPEDRRIVPIRIRLSDEDVVSFLRLLIPAGAEPREIDPDATTVLFTLNSTIAIEPGGTETVNIRYADPDRPGTRISALSTVTPVSGVRKRTPGDSHICPKTSTVCGRIPVRSISFQSSCPSRMRSPTPQKTEIPAWTFATL